MKFRKSVPHQSSAKAVCLMTLFALFAIIAFFAFAPDFKVSSQAAREKVSQNPGDERATPEMFAVALNFKSAADYQILAAKSEEANAQTAKELSETFSAIRQLPCTELKDAQTGGKSFAPGVYCLDSAELAGQMSLDGENDFAAKFVFLIRGNFTAKSGASVLLENGAQAANVFFVADDSIKVEENAAFAGNLLGRNDIDVSRSSTVKGRMVSAAGSINAGAESNLGGGNGTVQICKRVSNAAGTDISDRYYRFTISGVPGVVEVYVPPTAVGATFSEGCTNPFDVPIGQQTITELPTARLRTSAAGTFEAAPGSFVNFQLINVEQVRPLLPSIGGESSLGVVNLGTRTATINVVEGGPEGNLITRFTNVFAITGFIEICKQRANGPTLAAPAFGFAAQTFNPPAPGTTIPSGGDIDVSGFFSYTVEGVYSLNQINAPGSPTPTTRTYQVFTVPVGACSGIITVTVSPAPTTTAPRESIVRITELARPGFFLEKVTTRPFFDREVHDVQNPASSVIDPATGAGGEILGSRIIPPTAIVAAGPNAPRGIIDTNNVGGGYATVRVLESTVASATVVDFFNRSNPGVVKVCKIAAPGIPAGTIFRFSVFAPFGTTGFTLQPGTHTNPTSPQFIMIGAVSKIVDVPAGNPAIGGNCVIVPGIGAGADRAEFQTFINGTPVLVVENGVSPLNTTPVQPGAIRASRIRVLGPATGLLVLQNGTGAARAGFTPNQCAALSATQNCNGLASGDVTPAPTGFDGRNPMNAIPVDNPRIGRVAFNQRPGEIVAEFTNFLFNPTLLKICKIAGFDLVPDTRTFGFKITLTNDGPAGMGGALFPGNPGANASVVAGAPTAENPYGNCAFVDGSAFPGGAINVGSDITITENSGTAGTIVTAIQSPTSAGGGLTFELAARTVRLSGAGGVIAGVNIVAFTNSLSNLPQPRRTRFDFDGDGKADASIFRASTGTWSYAASSKGNEITSQRWGLATDKLIVADFDGDGKTDIAVFRPSNGTWYILGSSEGFRAVQFGTNGDIPQPGDYDGDGKDDVAVFRPSNGTWYMLGSRDGFSAVSFGIASDRPLAADYDGDGKFDQAVFRAGVWYLNRSRDGFAGVRWGLASDVPVPADYDGDGKADLAVFRSGNWYMLSANGAQSGVNWGIASDVPVPADYNGDGKAEVAVYRGGFWHILNQGALLTILLGSPSDIPLTGTQP